MSIKRFSPEYHRNLCAAFMGEDGSGDYVLFSDHEAEIAQLRAALDDLREERDESKAEARKWESAFDAVHDALQSEVEAKSTSYGRTEKLHETAARVLKERDELAAEIDAVWIETGVASTARGLTTLVDVIGTDKMNLRNALANLRKCDDRIIAMGDALAEHMQLTREAVQQCDVLRARIAELEQQPIRWRPIEEAPKDKDVFLWSRHLGDAFSGSWHSKFGWVDSQYNKLPNVTHFAEIVGPDGER